MPKTKNREPILRLKTLGASGGGGGIKKRRDSATAKGQAFLRAGVEKGYRAAAGRRFLGGGNNGVRMSDVSAKRKWVDLLEKPLNSVSLNRATKT